MIGPVPQNGWPTSISSPSTASTVASSSAKPYNVATMYGLIVKNSQQNGTISKVLIALIGYIFINKQEM
jgi:hypothetical protein